MKTFVLNTQSASNIEFYPTQNQNTLLFDGEDKLSSFKTIDPFYPWSVLKSPVDGKYYFASMGRADVNRDPYVFRYNASTNTIEQEQRVEFGIVTDDSHRSPILNIDSSGHIYLIGEELISTGDTHSSPIRIYKTTVPGDLSTMTLLKTISGRFSYAKLYINGSTLIVSARGDTNVGQTLNQNRSRYFVFKSTDGGATFDAGLKIYDSQNTNLVAYFHKVFDYNGEYYFVLNERNNSVGTWTFVSVIKTSDFVTYSDVGGTWSKNVSSSGFITRTEIRDAPLVHDSPDTALYNVNFEGGVVKTSGGIRIITTLQKKTGQIYVGNPQSLLQEIRFWTFNSGWSYNLIPFQRHRFWQFMWAYRRPVQYVNNNEDFDDMVMVDYSNLNNIYILRSTDNFATKPTTIKIAEGNSRYMLGQGCFNISDSDDYLFVFCDPVGDIGSIYYANESAIDYSNLFIVKP